MLLRNEKLNPRPYQTESFELAKEKNIIVNIPTGTGKTLIAVMVIDHYRKLKPYKKIMFVVPTTELVSQQSDYCRNNCTPQVHVAELCGGKIDSWDMDGWKQCLRNNTILVGTAEVFRRALVSFAYIDIEHFSLLIFDECHNVTGNSPSASIMRDVVHKSNYQPRVLGLTASFVNGAMKDLNKKREKLEEILTSNIFSPEVDTNIKEYNVIPYKVTQLTTERILVEQVIVKLLEGFNFINVKDGRKIVSRGVDTLSTLGMSAFVFYLDEGVARQLEKYATQLGETPNLQYITHFRTTAKIAAEKLKGDGRLSNFPFVTDKVQKLLNLLRKLQKNGRNFRGLIFVQRISTTYPLVHIINSHFASKISFPISGRGSMNDTARKNAMTEFRQGDVPVLVTTPALEEGIDVAECSFVIRFDIFNTTKSHIQGSGRARNHKAEIYYFENDPERELKNELLMNMVAKDDSLALTQAEMNERVQNQPSSHLHPFKHPQSTAELSIFNCMSTFYEYCQQVMKQSPVEEKLFEYSVTVIRRIPREERKILKKVVYPSPSGHITITKDDVDEYWGYETPQDVVPKDRIKNLSGADIEKRRFIFVTVIDMVKKGYVNERFKASSIAINKTRDVCSSWESDSYINVKNKYSPDSIFDTAPLSTPDFQQWPLNSNGPITSMVSSPRQGQSSGPITSMVSSPRQGQSSGPITTMVSANKFQMPVVEPKDPINYKGMMNQWAQKRWPNMSPNEIVQFITEELSKTPPIFVSTIILKGFENEHIVGNKHSNKKDAEQSAAKLAYQTVIAITY